MPAFGRTNKPNHWPNQSYIFPNFRVGLRMFAVSGGCGGHGLLPGLQGIAMGRAGGQARVGKIVLQYFVVWHEMGLFPGFSLL